MFKSQMRRWSTSALIHFRSRVRVVDGEIIVPKKLMLYARGSMVFGQFANPYEYGAGFKWYFLPTERLWLTGELVRVNKAPYSGAFTPYTAGMTGWMPMLQTILAF